MLDLPELLEKVFQYLNRHNLTQCAQVNKQWHTLTIPYIWRELEYAFIYSDEKREAFRRIVLEDYLQENGYEERPRQPSALSKYGHLMRLLPNPYDLERAFRSQAYNQQTTEPTAHDLLFHLFKRCSKAQVRSLRYQFKGLESDKMKAILAFALPRLRILYIRGSLQGTQSEFFKFKSVLEQCSTTLIHLSVDINIPRADEAVDMEDIATEDESIYWTSLKELTLRHDPDTWNAGPFWSWMWKRCRQLKRLNVPKIDKSTPSLVQAMLDYMPNLQEITFGEESFRDWDRGSETDMEDDIVGALISGCHGLKSVSVFSTATLGQETMKALTMHYSTLEKLDVGSYIPPSHDLLIQVLRSCPHLHTLTYANYSNGNAVIYGSVFIDVDPDTGLLKPWLCEGSLKNLILTLKIPQPDLGNEGALVEAYPGQGREIQSQVYDRLGRLTNLETLVLGGGTPRYLRERLELSLESGLEKLSGLKSLEKLSVQNVVTRIGDKEIQWMTENWPKLRVIYGVYDNGKVWRR